MSDIHIRVAGRAGRITLNRPEALNALTYKMCLAIEAALDDWRRDDAVDLVVIDAAGGKAFCAGGDLMEMYRTGRAGDYSYGRQFWADEYRLNAKIANYPKPYVAFMQGFTMGGGVGVSAHGSHRIVCDSSRVAMPECGIGLVPDVGGSLLLARAPGHLGTYLAATTGRMGPGDAIHAGFADTFIPDAAWPGLIASLEATGDPEAIAAACRTAPDAPLAEEQDRIDALFGHASHLDIARAVQEDQGAWSTKAHDKMSAHSPLAVACAIELVRRARIADRVEDALSQEYRYTYRCMEHGDFLEGIRALIVDKDRNPQWRHGSLQDVGPDEVDAMLRPLDEGTLELEENGA